MARTSVATSTFTQADGALPADWASLNTDWGSPTVASNALRGPNNTSNADQVAATRWVGAGTFTDNQYAKPTISALAFNGTWFVAGAIVLAHPNGTDLLLFATGANGACYRYNAGSNTWTQLANHQLADAPTFVGAAIQEYGVVLFLVHAGGGTGQSYARVFKP